MKLALDIHGVIDTNPTFFKTLARAVKKGGGEVYILTGKHIEREVIKELEKFGFHLGTHYNHLFSISDYHKYIGTKMWGDTKNPWMEDEIWNRTKADFCKRNEIDLCIDDKKEYIPYFTTPVVLYEHTDTLSEKKKKELVKKLQDLKKVVLRVKEHTCLCGKTCPGEELQILRERQSDGKKVFEVLSTLRREFIELKEKFDELYDRTKSSRTDED